MKRKFFVVTGGSGGIGREIVRQLAARHHRVAAIARSVEKIPKAAGIFAVSADLSSASGVRRAANQVAGLTEHLDGLVNCASAVHSKRQVTPDGLEATFALNYLSYFHLTGLLLPRMGVVAPSRIVNVSARPIPWAKLDFDNLQLERGYGGARAYMRSKLADVIFTYELSAHVRDRAVTANAVHPGIVKSNLGRETSQGMLKLIGDIARWFAEEPRTSAERIVRLLLDPELEGISGRFFAAGEETRSSRYSYDLNARKALWQESIRLLGYDPFAASSEPTAS